MDWKKIGKNLLFPHMVVLWLLLPICTVGLVGSMQKLEQTHPVRIGFYALSFYTLVIWCARVPQMIRTYKSFKRKNKYARRWSRDVHLRVKATLLGNVLWNSAYGALELCLGIYHRSAWFYALAGYYFSLAVMRFCLLRHTLRHRPGEDPRRELRNYRTCGWVFLFTNLMLTAMRFYMIYENRMVRHHEITTIAMAAYTFTSLTMAIINVVKYRKYNSPVFSASKAISLAAACVSMLTLEGTMLATFQKGTITAQMQRVIMSISGGAVSVLIVTMAIYMIGKANRKMKCLEKQNG